jgi:hypothetical protein
MGLDSFVQLLVNGLSYMLGVTHAHTLCYQDYCQEL